MDFDAVITGSFEYAKDGLVGHWGKWVYLIILALLPMIPIILGVVMWIFTFSKAPATAIPVFAVLLILAMILLLPFMGYLVQVYRGDVPAPEVQNWGSLFGNGLKLFIIYLVYAIPILIITVALLGSTLYTLFLHGTESITNSGNLLGVIGAIIFGIVILLIAAFILWLIVATAVVRFSRTNRIGEAFNFGAIFSHISKIGVGSYIVALLLMAVIVGIVMTILNAIPYLGIVLVLGASPPIALFQARYLCMVYDSAGTT